MDGAPLPPTGVTQQELDALWAELLADADAAWLAYMQQRVPPALQEHLQYYVDQVNQPEIPPPTQATVNDGDAVPVTNAAGVALGGSPGVAAVVDGALSIKLTLVGALVQNGATVPMRAGALIGGQASVTGSVLTQVIAPASAAFVQSNDTIAVQDAAGDAVAGSPGAATVASSAVTNVKLTV